MPAGAPRRPLPADRSYRARSIDGAFASSLHSCGGIDRCPRPARRSPLPSCTARTTSRRCGHRPDRAPARGRQRHLPVDPAARLPRGWLSARQIGRRAERGHARAGRGDRRAGVPVGPIGARPVLPRHLHRGVPRALARRAEDRRAAAGLRDDHLRRARPVRPRAPPALPARVIPVRGRGTHHHPDRVHQRDDRGALSARGRARRSRRPPTDLSIGLREPRRDGRAQRVDEGAAARLLRHDRPGPRLRGRGGAGGASEPTSPGVASAPVANVPRLAHVGWSFDAA